MKNLPTSYDYLVSTYNGLVNLYYKVRFMKPNLNLIKKAMDILRVYKARSIRAELIIERGHLYTRKIPDKYIKRIKYRYFRPLGFVIEEGIDADTLLAMINQIILLIYKILTSKLIKIRRFNRVIYAISISTRNRGSTRRHVEAHFICDVPSGREKELENSALSLLEKFIRCVGYDFMLYVFNVFSGINIIERNVKYSNKLSFKIYDFNYPSSSNQVPLTKFINYAGDRKVPGVKASATLYVNEWWKHVDKIMKVLCNYSKEYY